MLPPSKELNHIKERNREINSILLCQCFRLLIVTALTYFVLQSKDLTAVKNLNLYVL
jgi:hypothetical protein